MLINDVTIRKTATGLEGMAAGVALFEGAYGQMYDGHSFEPTR